MNGALGQGRGSQFWKSLCPDKEGAYGYQRWDIGKSWMKRIGMRGPVDATKQAKRKRYKKVNNKTIQSVLQPGETSVILPISPSP